MITWPIAMLCLLPLLAIGDMRTVAGVPVPWGPMARTWAAMFGAALIGGMLPYDSVRTFAVIDLLAAVIVLPAPRGEAQRLIGFLFGGMVFAHVGFYSSIAGRLQLGPDDFIGYAMLNRELGWIQFAALLSGGGYAAYRYAVHGRDARGSRAHIRVGAAK